MDQTNNNISFLCNSDQLQWPIKLITLTHTHTGYSKNRESGSASDAAQRITTLEEVKTDVQKGFTCGISSFVPGS